MNKQEAIKLLAMIKVAYPTAYRDMDEASKMATVNMWATSFPDVPYQIMEQAFNHYRMTAKFPPTVAEMVEELKQVYYAAVEGACIHKTLGNRELVSCYQEIMHYTNRYAKGEVGGLNIDSLIPMLNGGDYDAGTSRNRLDRENRIPVLASGRWGDGRG